MPSWAIHLAIATKLNKSSKMNNQDKNIFLIGNIFPDILNGFVVKNVSHQISHNETHFAIEVQINNHKERRHDIKGFYDRFHEKFDNPLILGYYAHIITDSFWNNIAYGNKGVFDEDKKVIGLQLNNGEIFIAPKDKLRELKTNDFKLFSKYIYENNLAEIPIFDEKILEYAKDVDWLKLEKSDITETISYIEEMATLKKTIETDYPQYQIFSQKEMQENFDNCVKDLENKLNK